jgi:isocitrate dehydrogenase kinase/phosphatase
MPREKAGQTRFKERLRHAFSVKVASDLPPEMADELIDRICQKLFEKNLLEPAVMFVQSSYPMAYYGSQAMLVLEPFIAGFLELFWPAFLEVAPYEELQRLFENREYVQRFLARLDDYLAEKKFAKRTQKRKRWRWR